MKDTSDWTTRWDDQNDEPVASTTECLHCGAPENRRTGKVCDVCNREARRVYMLPYLGPRFDAKASAPDAFEISGGTCEIRCSDCAELFMSAPPNDADVLASEPGECDCGVVFSVSWDGVAYVTARVGAMLETSNAIELDKPAHKSKPGRAAKSTKTKTKTEKPADEIPTFGRVVDDNVHVQSMRVEPEAKPADAIDDRYKVEHAPRVIQTHDHRVHPMLPSCKLLAKTVAHSDEWHAARASGIGSSDAGAVLGLSPFGTSVDVWSAKMGIEPDRKPWLEPYGDFGTFFEPHLRHALRVDGVDLIDGEDIGTLQSLTWPIALANVDGLDAVTGDNYEIKTSSETWSEVPAYYVAQVQHQMYVTGADRTILHQYIMPYDRRDLPVWMRHISKLTLMDVEAENCIASILLEVGERKNWVIEYDPEYAARLIAREREFWECVTSGTEPATLDAEGTADLSDCDELVGLLDMYTLENARVPRDAIKAADKLKKSARGVIDEALALRGVKAKRITAGPHKATWVHPKGRPSGSWTIYGGDDDSINF
jgi:putative phage-type endonuclease